MAEHYDVIGQRQTSIIDATNRVVEVMRITFQTKPTATIGEIDIPLSLYDAMTVDALVSQRVAQIESVNQL